MDEQEHDRNPEELMSLLAEGEQLVRTAPIFGGNTISNPHWRAWTARRQIWLEKVTRVLIHEALHGGTQEANEDVSSF